jgi:hypothetical protein
VQIYIIIGDPWKNDLHIRVLAAFQESGWGKLCGKKQLDKKGLASHWVRYKSAVFLQTERLLGLFSTGT